MTEFIPAVAQLLCSVLFGAVLFFTWRNVAGAGRPIFWLVTAGLLGRAFAGQVLFWVSYLRLPFGRSLQLGDGFWFFAADGTYYFARAAAAAHSGLDAIIFLDRTEASVFYIQSLAAFAYLFGTSPAVALLLNIGAYLGICAIALRLAPPHATRSRIAAIAALSLMPSMVLWSLQPLKDVYFLFVVALFVFACHLWQRLAVGDDAAPNMTRRRIGAAALMIVSLYGISGVRWYFAMALVIAAGLFLLLTTVRSDQRRALVGSSAAILLLLLVAFRVGGGPYIPDPIRNALTLNRNTVKNVAQAPEFVFGAVERARRSFDSVAGATTIGAGTAVQEQKKPPVTTPPAPPAQPVATVADAQPAATVADAQPAATLADAQPAAAVAEAQPAATVAEAQPAATVAEAQSAATVAEAQPAAVPTAGAAAVPAAAQPAPVEPKPARRASRRKTSAAKVARAQSKTEPAPAIAAAPAAPVAAEPVKVQPQPAPVVPQAAAAAAAPEPTPTVDSSTPQEPADPSQSIMLPASPVARFVSGAAAVMLPKSVGEALGLFRVSGGRGLWLFVELDTLLFDVILLYALYCLATRFRLAVRTPAFWLILAMLILVGAPLMYTVSNFGTLFRHRNMIYIGLVLLPLTFATAAAARGPVEQQQ